ncbi:MAG TPA: hypothetical protein VJ306_06260 [Pyrinomonadaceae bacterium]|jgi:hypothetical protein|nr:hypothetical protein [Pyrinomonadaceae bacterium]
MLSSIAKLFVSVAVVMLILCTSLTSADAAVFRDRASFNAASQNLATIDFESGANRPDGLGFLEIDGVYFFGLGGVPSIVTGQNGNKLLHESTVGEITRLTIFLPPGTTAVGVDQFNRPMIVSTSTGESVTMEQSDNSDFVGFVSDQPIQSLVIMFDFPEPTPDALVDNLSFGQRRVGNEPPVPQLLVTNTGRAAALDSVTTTSEPFLVLGSQLLATDGHTRITLFVVGVLLQPSDLPFVTVQAEDSQQRLFDLPCEATARVKNLSWMSQVTVRLPDALIGAGDVNIRVRVRGKESNPATLRIQ